MNFDTRKSYSTKGAIAVMYFIRKYFSITFFLLSIGIGTIISLILFYFYPDGDIVGYTLICLCIGVFLVYPVILTLLNLFFLFWNPMDDFWIQKSRKIEYITIVLGCLYTLLAHLFLDIRYDVDWQEALIWYQDHTPVWTEGSLTVVVLGAVGVLGYLLLSAAPLSKLPPLVTVLAIAAMYVGIIQFLLWSIQMFHKEYVWLSLFPFNCIVLAAKLIRRLMGEWKEIQDRKTLHNLFLDKINQKLMNSATWPFAAFLLMWPLLGILIGILILFGQQPDAMIKAWTETSDWNLSLREAPPDIMEDDHYLCTVAAGGHPAVVKPLRMGQRRGHPIIVNRQLCVANAFEQVLEERLPGFHRHIRRFYDTYGFSLAKRIRSRYLADLIYILMKPLEWSFLAVLYFTDVHPENRIAIQYMPSKETKVICKESE